MIETKALSKSFGHLQAVKDLTFRIERGQIVGLLGRNGAGKTTTMRLLTTFLAPSSGTAAVAGFDIINEPQEVRRHIGYLPESPPLYPEMRVREYLSFIAGIRNVPASKRCAAVADVIDRCFLGDAANRLCGQLSKGYRQRTGLAAALVHNPDVLILDEPTSGLDPAQIVDVRALIRQLAGSHTVVLSTHILQEVSQTCSRVIIIAQGQLVLESDLAELTKEKGLEERFLEVAAGGPVEQHPAPGGRM